MGGYGVDMDTETLRWFQQVADGATLTEVGELEMVSQPGVSRALARLESEVGTPLFRRAGRTVTLTHAGAAFKRHVDAVIHHLDDGLAAVQQLLDPETGTVTLVFQPSLGTWLVPDLVGSFREDHPGIRFDLRTKADELLPGVGTRSEVDLELSTLRPPTQGYHWRGLLREPLRLVVPDSDPLVGERSVALSDVADQPFVTIRSSSLLRRQFEELCERAGFTPYLAFVADDLPTLRGYVAAGLGIAVVPTHWDTSAEPAARRVRHLELTDAGAEREVGLVRAAERRMLPAAELFRRHVLQRARAGRLPSPLDVGV